jgi:hypothetical protein
MVARGRPFAANLVNFGPLVGTSTTVTLPTNGATIYAQLQTSFTNGTILLSSINNYTDSRNELVANSLEAFTSAAQPNVLRSRWFDMNRLPRRPIRSPRSSCYSCRKSFPATSADTHLSNGSL